jgi:hypothetical protein
MSCLLVCLVNVAAYAPSSDYKMHCLYLYKFSQLVQWPEENTGGEFNIGIVGVSPLIPQLEQYIAAKNKYSIVKCRVIRFTTVQAISKCDMLYVTKEQLPGFDMILKNLAGKPTLLVSEVPGLIKRGACINLIIDDGASIKIQINKAAIESHRLKASPELLKLGSEVM